VRKFATVTLVVLMWANGFALADDDVILPLPAEDQQKIDALLGPGIVGKALPSKPIQDASVYFRFIIGRSPIRSPPARMSGTPRPSMSRTSSALAASTRGGFNSRRHWPASSA
jgi:hypothetical protein